MTLSDFCLDRLKKSLITVKTNNALDYMIKFYNNKNFIKITQILKYTFKLK